MSPFSEAPVKPRSGNAVGVDVAAIVAVVVAVIGLIVARRRRRERLPGRAVIVSPRKSTVISSDGAVRSVQSVELTCSTDEFERLWSPTNLENLARTYWKFLSTVTLQVIRVYYGDDERRVALLVRPLTLLRFDAPQYNFAADHGQVSWKIKGGLLVSRAHHCDGFLALDVRRLPERGEPGMTTLRIDVEVANFYPAIASGFGQLVYEATQSFVHVLVTHAFLRSLASLELEESVVGALRPPDPVDAQPR
jgi:hypothetical protein